MKNSNNIPTIDIMRGLIIFLMLFVNDLYEPGVPHWLVHTKAEADGMGLADWVFPGFLFIVGLSIPFAISARMAADNSKLMSILHILKRTFAHLLIGVLMVNTDRYDGETGFLNKTVWIVLTYLSIFMIWNKYPNGSNYTRFFTFLKYLGICLLALLAFLFRSSPTESSGWLIVGWWGILGLIGWGYLVASVTYLLVKDDLLNASIVFILFVILNIINQFDILNVPDFISNIFGVIIDGNVPSIVLTGLLAGIFTKIYREKPTKLWSRLLPLGLVFIAFGFFLRQRFIISKINGTPPWAFLCSGISIVIYCILYYLVEIRHFQGLFTFFKSAGKNSLSAYLAPDVIYFLLWSIPFNIFFYKQDNYPLVAVAGSFGWATMMLFFAHFLSKISIQLKL